MKITTFSLMLLLSASVWSSKAQSTITNTPQFSIAAGDVVSTSVEVVTGRMPASPAQEIATLHLKFSKAKAAEFREFTKKHIKQKVQIMVGTNVVAEPVIRAEILGPKIELGFSSPEKAHAVADSLRKK